MDINFAPKGFRDSRSGSWGIGIGKLNFKDDTYTKSINSDTFSLHSDFIRRSGLYFFGGRIGIAVHKLQQRTSENKEYIHGVYVDLTLGINLSNIDLYMGYRPYMLGGIGSEETIRGYIAGVRFIL